MTVRRIKRMNILILAGGLSPEREVSFTSGCRIATALIGRGHRVCLCDPYTGCDPDGKPPVYTADAIRPRRIGMKVPDLATLKRESGRGERRIAPGVMELCRTAEVVFIALHGDIGEDGRLQAMLETEGIRHTGSGYAGCLLAMDKDIAKRLFREVDILTPDWVHCDLSRQTAETAAAHIEETVGYPCVVNDPELIRQAVALAETEGIPFQMLPLRMTSEDFGFYGTRYPAIFYRLGVGPGAGKLHTSTFNPDEAAIPTGIRFMELLARNYFNR